MPGEMSDEDLARWDEWFVIVDRADVWASVKAVMPRERWQRWAEIIELNRLDEVMEARQL